MIDFVSTREDTDVESAKCARLVASIIALAVNDAGRPLSKNEIEKGRNSFECESAIRFLFSSDSIFNEYAQLIGIDESEFRKRLVTDDGKECMEEKGGFSDRNRKNIRSRIRLCVFGMGVDTVCDDLIKGS